MNHLLFLSLEEFVTNKSLTQSFKVNIIFSTTQRAWSLHQKANKISVIVMRNVDSRREDFMSNYATDKSMHIGSITYQSSFRSDALATFSFTWNIKHICFQPIITVAANVNNIERKHFNYHFLFSIELTKSSLGFKFLI